jgi:hypothetical protein
MLKSHVLFEVIRSASGCPIANRNKMRVMDGSSGSASLMGAPSDLHHKGKAGQLEEIDDEMYFELSDNESEISGDHESYSDDEKAVDLSSKKSTKS